MRNLPPHTDLLLDELEKLYPARCRLPKETEREHERYAGKVDLIQELRNRQARS